TVTVFDTSAFDAFGDVEVGLGPARATISPDGRYVFVSCYGDDTLHIIDTATNVNVTSISVNRNPSAMAFSPTGDQFYVCSRAQDVVTIYDVSEDENGVPALEFVGDVATGSTPAGIAVSGDGSRLVISNEGSDSVSVIFLRSGVQQIFDVLDPESGASIRSADVGQSINITGQNFDPNVEANIVLFKAPDATAVAATVDEENSSLGVLRVTVPEGAVSGSLVVVNNNEESNPIDFIITPDLPKIVRTTPPAGAINVTPDTLIVIRFSEPMTNIAADDIEVRRMLDTFTGGVRDEGDVVEGEIRTNDFEHELIFDPATPLESEENSNNIYRVTVFTTITDRAGKPLDKQERFTFRLDDTRGPTLVRAFYLDPNNNGVDAGDIVNLEFDETLSLPGEGISADGIAGLNDDSTLGTGVTLEAPGLPENISSAASDVLAQLSRTASLRLGTGVDILVPGERTAIVDITNLSGELAISDKSGNTTLSVDGDVDIAPFVNQMPEPRALAVILNDLNGNEVGDNGETIGIYCNTPLTNVDDFSIANLAVAGGGSLGNGASADLDPDNKRVIEITLGTSPNMNFSNLPGSFSHYIITLPSSADVASLVSFTDVALDEITASSSITYSVGELAGGPSIAADPIYHDLNDDLPGPSAGDVILVTFDTEVAVGPASADSAFVMSVIGDRFGTGAYISGAQQTYDGLISESDVGRTVVINLGTAPILRPDGDFASGSTGFGGSSGLNINPNIPVWTITNVFGASAQASDSPHPITSSDTEGPVLLTAKFDDTDKSGSPNLNDSIILTFDEPVTTNGATSGSFELTQSGVGTGLSFGTGAILTRALDLPNSDRVYRIILGTSPVFTIDGNTDVGPVSGNPMADASGNEVQAGPVPITVSIVNPPLLEKAFFNDVDGNGVDVNDRLTMKFNQPMVLESTDPFQLFLLTSSSDSFGGGASAAIATVTQAMINAGLTTAAVGASDARLVTVTLGEGASLSNIHGISNVTAKPYSSTFSASSGAASGIIVNYATAAGFTESALSSSSILNQSSVVFTFDGLETVTISTVFSTADLSNGAAAAIAKRLNFEFLSDGLRVRAFANTTASGTKELAIADNGEGFFDTSVTIDITTPPTSITGYMNSGIDDELRNLAGIVPRGGADIFAAASTTAPVLLSATLDDVSGLLELVFSKPVEANLNEGVGTLFALPVGNAEPNLPGRDTFGSSSSISSGNDGTRLVIAFGSDAVFNPSTNQASVAVDIAAGTVESSQISVDQVSPANGPASGGTTVSITGVGFTSGSPVLVYFGQDPAANVTVVSDTEIQCVTPGGSPS
ncbi:MAG: IPT/TIG domain-containing protein, partial [Planctomycetes bacterium]|nr:IPT/TIG domain-containing protein [Planctomycetota bacterium]